jgi:hypothetical protein
MLVLAGCVGQVPPSASDTALAPTQATLQNCREFTAQVRVEGQPRQAVGQTCQMPDGSWQVTVNTPGLPQQVYTLPPQAISLYPYAEQYDWWDPWFYGPPLFVSSPVFLVHGFHRFHRHDFSHNGASHPGGSHHGGSHGGRR